MRCLILAAAFPVAAVGPAEAQVLPTRSINIVVPYAPGKPGRCLHPRVGRALHPRADQRFPALKG